MKTIITFLLVSLVLTLSSTAELSKIMPYKEYQIPTGNEKLPDVIAYPYNQGLLTESPGIEIGMTYYDCQSVGSVGNRIALDTYGNKSLCWMSLPDWPYPPVPRGVYCAWISADNDIFYTGQIGGDNSGWPNLDIIYGNQAAIAFTDIAIDVALAIVNPDTGYIQYYDPPGQFSPRITVDRNDNIHILAKEMTSTWLLELKYTNSTDGGHTWSRSRLVDSVIVSGGVIDASPVSDRVVIAWAHPSDTTTQWKNDICYISSEDGLSWDFLNDRINITNYADDDDSLWAYTDLDVIIDYNDYIHIIWNAQWVAEEGVYYRTFLYHYNEGTDELNIITAHPDSLWMDISGAWNRPICKMSMGVQDGSNALFAIWTKYDTTDISIGGYGNGELYMSYNLNGSDWSFPANITNSITPDCYPGDCDSDIYATLADEVNQSLHITYINDKDAGCVIQEEGSAAENPVMYLELAVDTTGINDNIKKPENIILYQNYPNPFNAATNIEFALPRQAHVTVKIYDITGALTAILLKGIRPAGHHILTWDASEFSSGMYFVNLKLGEKSFTRKMVLLK